MGWNIGTYDPITNEVVLFGPEYKNRRAAQEAAKAGVTEHVFPDGAPILLFDPFGRGERLDWADRAGL